MEPSSFSHLSPASPTQSRTRRESSSTYFSDYSDGTAVSDFDDWDRKCLIESLPNELWTAVFEELDVCDFARIVCVCRFFRDVVTTADTLTVVAKRNLALDSFVPFHSYKRFHQHYRNVVWLGCGIWWGDRQVFGSMLRTFYDPAFNAFGMQHILVTNNSEPRHRDPQDPSPHILPFEPSVLLAPVCVYATSDLYYDQIGEIHPSAVPEQISYAVQRAVNMPRDRRHPSMSLWPPDGHTVERTRNQSPTDFGGAINILAASDKLFRLRRRLCPFRSNTRESSVLTETFGKVEMWHGQLGGLFCCAGRGDDGPVFLNLQHTKHSLTAVHITGGTHIPRGECAFMSDLAPTSHPVTQLAQYPGYTAWAQVAEHNYTMAEYYPVTMIIVDSNTIGLYWSDFNDVYFLFRIDEESLRRGNPVVLGKAPKCVG